MYTVISILAFINRQWLDYEKIPDPGPTPTTWNIGEMLSIVNDPALAAAHFYITVVHPDFVGEKQIRFGDIPDLLSHTNEELDVYLNTDAAFTTHVIPTVTEGEERSITNPKSIKYWDGVDFGFGFEPAYIDVGGGPVGAFKPDLKLKRIDAQQNTPTGIINEYLVAINGRVYLPEVIDDAAYIRRGWLRLNPEVRIDRNHGIIDFTEAGQFIPERIIADNADILYTDASKTTIRIKSSVDLKTHTTFLVIDGLWKHAQWRKLDHEYVSVTIDHSYAVSQATDTANNLPWIEPANLMNGGYDLGSFDGVAYVSAGNSFMVHIPKLEMGVLKEMLGRTEFDSHFTHYRVPRGLLFLSDGTLGHYRVDGVEQLEASILCSEPTYRRFAADTVPESLQVGGIGQLDLVPDAVQATVWHHDYYFTH